MKIQSIVSFADNGGTTTGDSNAVPATIKPRDPMMELRQDGVVHMFDFHSNVEHWRRDGTSAYPLQDWHE